ncbi:MAG TPA: crosslink repair DNA glycosylase YcaQ family protein, partial [Candidatus Limnocylindrales bacterium]|nr:crosslink repair DNA glycosylase YcaQ family protein [Candidatus Limnocylindrales bacterium]
MGSDPLELFHPAVREWFRTSFAAPTPAQAQAWPAIKSGGSTLLMAPTGSGKTLAAFLSSIDDLSQRPAGGCRVLYISPLKALVVDVERNLRSPIAGIGHAATRLGASLREPTVAIRTGDTPAKERLRFIKSPADIFITTPESLYLVLSSSAGSALKDVETVIVDEIHAMVSTKRGAHLALSLERLERLVAQSHPERKRALQRIGLSATQRPLDEVARFLGGFTAEGPRPVGIVDAGHRKALELRVEVPVEDMARLGEPLEFRSGPVTRTDGRTSIWPAIHPRLLELVREHRSTLIFVNSRRLAERIAAAVNELAGEEIAYAHHGSIAREQRLRIEDDLKAGRIRALVATSTLELGIDMGAIDLVIQIETPPSVASGMQRIGRAGHQVDAPSTGIILPKYRGDLLASAALTERMHAGAVEASRYIRNPLDVLAQHVVAIAGRDEINVDELEVLVQGAAPFAELPRAQLENVLDMLSGRYPSDEFVDLRPRIVWDRVAGTIRAREGAARIALTSGGTIPDRGLYGVFLVGAEAGKGRVGELDEEMVFETRVGETFLLGASSWRVEEITHDRVLVSPAPGVPGKMPFWKGETANRPLEFGRAIGALTRTLRSEDNETATTRLRERHDLNELAAKNLLEYLRDQHAAAGAVPDDRTILIERYVDEVGDWRVCILTPFGGRVHAPWAMAIGAMVRERSDLEVDILWTDDGIVARFPEADRPPDPDVVLPDPDTVEAMVIDRLGQTPLFAARFREASARALLLPRRYPGQRSPLWHQRRRAGDLLQIASRFSSFPMILEAYRECLQDVFDMPALIEVLRGIRSRDIRTVTVDSRTPSPFASALLFEYVGNFIYEGDAPLAERRAQALTVDPLQLRQLLGEAELRELLDRDVLAELELQLQHLAPDRAAKHPDGVHDLLMRLGDLTRDEIAARTIPGAHVDEWIADLVRERRIIGVPLALETRFIAAEDAAKYRDALGVVIPQGIPDAFLISEPRPVAALVRRYARTHGPFIAADLARRLGIGPAIVSAALAELSAAGTVVEGEFRPGGHGVEWIDAGVLRTLRQRSLARLRKEIEPVEQSALARFEIAWHGVDSPRSGEAALLDAIAQLEGAAIPASDLESRVLPSRVSGYEESHLDGLLASGAVLWIGAGAIGPRDGRVALYLAEHASLVPAPPEPHAGKTHDRIRETLSTRGALFFPQLLAALGGGFAPEVKDALWDLVWAGEITNDSLHPVRAVLKPSPVRNMRRRGPAQRGVAPDLAGRWSLVASYRDETLTATERLAARVRQLLDRYGVITREVVQAEEISGGFAAVYGVLRAMEEAGRVRRGYFVAGRGAAQFALPGAVDRLRTLREPDEDAEPKVVTLAATDPANPYGAALGWPKHGADESEVDATEERAERRAQAGVRRPMRTAGALVVLIDGALAAWVA